MTKASRELGERADPKQRRANTEALGVTGTKIIALYLNGGMNGNEGKIRSVKRLSNTREILKAESKSLPALQATECYVELQPRIRRGYGGIARSFIIDASARGDY